MRDPLSESWSSLHARRQEQASEGIVNRDSEGDATATTQQLIRQPEIIPQLTQTQYSVFGTRWEMQTDSREDKYSHHMHHTLA